MTEMNETMWIVKKCTNKTVYMCMNSFSFYFSFKLYRLFVYENYTHIQEKDASVGTVNTRYKCSFQIIKISTKFTKNESLGS